MSCGYVASYAIPDSKVHGANMGPTWDRQGPGGPHVGPMKFAIWDVFWVTPLVLGQLYDYTKIIVMILKDMGN